MSVDYKDLSRDVIHLAGNLLIFIKKIIWGFKGFKT